MSDSEKKLLAVMQADAAIWKRKAMVMDNATGAEPTKIDLTKQQAQRAANVRAKAARAATSNRPPRGTIGTMGLVEMGDRLCAPTVKCQWCGKPFGAVTRGKRAPAMYCGKACSHAAWRTRKILANG